MWDLVGNPEDRFSHNEAHLLYIAVKVADKMQKEVTAKRSLVDTLQSKVRWLEDQIDTLIKVFH